MLVMYCIGVTVHWIVSRLSIRKFTVNASSRAAMVGILFRIFAFAREANADFHWITIPEGVDIVGDEAFDPVLMRVLYDVGYEFARKGLVWSTSPPGMQTSRP
jgi:hypothetical protein